MLAQRGIVAVRYEVDGCEATLKVLSNCLGKQGKYDFTYAPGSDRWLARDDNSLFGHVPLGAAELAGRLHDKKVVASEYVQSGLDALPPDMIYHRDMLSGAEFSEATHVVSQIYLGAFTMVSGEEHQVGAGVSIFGLGAEGSMVRGMKIERAAGEKEVCEQGSREKRKLSGCDIPLKLGLLPLEGTPPLGAPHSAPTATNPPARQASASGVAASMVRIEGGSFKMGTDYGEFGSQPAHLVTVSSFSMDVTEVTVSAYEACVRGGACTEPDKENSCNWGVSGRANHPINCVDWNQATKYCSWVHKRLPTEEEWEFAARLGGPRGDKYPWGNSDPSDRLCWNGEKLGGWNRQSTCEVGSFPGGNTSAGLEDMAGNVWEWTSSEDCPYTQSGYDVGNCKTARIVRGGGWDSRDAVRVSSAFRDTNAPASRNIYVGFRCVRTPLDVVPSFTVRAVCGLPPSALWPRTGAVAAVGPQEQQWA